MDEGPVEADEVEVSEEVTEPEIEAEPEVEEPEVEPEDVTEVSEPEDSEETSEVEEAEAAYQDTAENEVNNTGAVLKNQTIDPSTKSNTSMSWGFGGQRDEFNRPMPALNAQDNYGSLGADFIFKTQKKIIFLTFDEGYENGYTPQILDTLKKKKVKAVFFVTKPYAEANGDLVQRMIDEGHIVGNHSVHHPADGLPAHDADYQTHEVTDLHDYIKKNFDYEMYLFRYPAGIYSEQSLAIVQNCNYRSVFWSFAYQDWDPDKQPEKTAALQKLKDNLHPGAIYLLHAVSATNTEILGSFIDEAEAQGYKFADYSKHLK